MGERRYRVIAVPDPGLLKVQRWITQRILAKVRPNPASTAYSKGDTLVVAATPHCRCRWLIKLDVQNFFESINEIAAYRVFWSLGYQALISFEMARLCTRLGQATARRTTDRWLSRSWDHHVITAYATYRMGHLPQGAATSPMLANLAVRRSDELLSEVATNQGLIYTRYADDLTLSTREDRYSRKRCRHMIGQAYAVMGQFGLSPNVTKTRVTPPGSRKIVLGLLVDGSEPRLPRDFKAIMRQHIHFLRRPGFGPAVHAAARGFASIAGLKHHVYGLVNFAKQVEPAYGKGCEGALATVEWPI